MPNFLHASRHSMTTLPVKAGVAASQFLQSRCNHTSLPVHLKKPQQSS